MYCDPVVVGRIRENEVNGLSLNDYLVTTVLNTNRPTSKQSKTRGRKRLSQSVTLEDIQPLQI